MLRLRISFLGCLALAACSSRGAAPPPIEQPALRDELLRRVAQDQEVRDSLVVQVGADGVNAATLLIQHADADPGFQADVLPLFEAAHRAGDVTGQEVALPSLADDRQVLESVYVGSGVR